MSRLLFSLAATGWCSFMAGILLHSMKHASSPWLTIAGLVGIFIGWLAMMQIAKDC